MNPLILRLFAVERHRFSSDGDGGGFPEQRWGFWALVCEKPADVKAERADSFTMSVEKKVAARHENGCTFIFSITVSFSLF